MPLLSEFFKGDRALERCQVLDSAHVLSGAVGDHVNKIQVALLVLDSARIARGEFDLKR